MKNPARTACTAWLICLLPFAVALPSPAAEVPSAPATEITLPSCFGELREHPLPESLSWAADVRWLGEQELAIAAVKAGVVQLRLDRPEAPLVTKIAPSGRRSASQAPWSLGSSAQYLAIGATMFMVEWKSLGPTRPAGQGYFEFIADLDVRDDKLLVLGIRKNEAGDAYAEMGAFA